MRVLFKRSLSEDWDVIRERYPHLPQDEAMLQQLTDEILECEYLANRDNVVISSEKIVRGDHHPGRKYPPRHTVAYHYIIEFEGTPITQNTLELEAEGIIYGGYELLDNNNGKESNVA